jgi:hypothetical protein
MNTVFSFSSGTTRASRNTGPQARSRNGP